MVRRSYHQPTGVDGCEKRERPPSRTSPITISSSNGPWDVGGGAQTHRSHGASPTAPGKAPAPSPGSTVSLPG